MALRQLLSQLVLGIPESTFTPVEDESVVSLSKPIHKLLSGEADELIADPEVSQLISKSSNVNNVVSETYSSLESQFGDLAPVHLQLLAIATLQLFIQANFTGPELLHSAADSLGLGDQQRLVEQLTIEGIPAYDLMLEPGYLVFALRAFEQLSGVPENWHQQPLENVTEAAGSFASQLNGNPAQASLQWWRARALQVHTMVINEPADILGTVSSVLLNSSVVNALAPSSETSTDVVSAIQQLYYIESIRSHIHGGTEHLAVPLIHDLTKKSQLQLVLTGAKAKHTKFQTFFSSSLVVLAKSQSKSLYDTDDVSANPTSYDLESDLLLEKPQYEQLENLEVDDSNPAAKRFKYDVEEESEEKLMPIALSADSIPKSLAELDPNHQPRLGDLDNIQLLLRLIAISQTSPSGDALVEEELMAIVSRIIYAENPDNKAANPTIFGRALWHRSMIETKKSRTVERGILQMTSLVEEAGIQIKSRVFAQGKLDAKVVASRMRFIHQLPLLSSWSMNGQMAKCYMSFGAFKSAIDIYERLGMVHDAAVCYAATEDLTTAMNMMNKRLESHPNDARAMSILGDFTLDPTLWEKSWEIGKYPKAKASLSRYWYNPPADSGHTRNIDLAIKHMNQCLSVSPLNYENWYFYGCCGLESGQFELAAEAFSRCVALDDTSAQAWSNLATALLQFEDKLKPAFNALKRAARLGYESKQWKIFENFVTVAIKLEQWQDVVFGLSRLLHMRSSQGESAVDPAVFEEVAKVLCSFDYSEDKLSHFQKAATNLICEELPKVITHNAQLWRIVAKVEAWRKRPWAALEAYEKAARALTVRPEVEYEPTAWQSAVDAVSDLVAAYENYADLPGRHGSGDVVCSNWKYKARQVVRGLMSKGKQSFEDDQGWEQLKMLKEDLK